MPEEACHQGALPAPPTRAAARGFRLSADAPDHRQRLSGSGKSVALHMLEDIDFYCVDNIPAALLKPFISHTVRGMGEVYPRTAVGLDARNRPNEIEDHAGAGRR
jgi:hypothetical protein